jgi:hypothetical protein
MNDLASSPGLFMEVLFSFFFPGVVDPEDTKLIEYSMKAGRIRVDFRKP